MCGWWWWYRRLVLLTRSIFFSYDLDFAWIARRECFTFFLNVCKATSRNETFPSQAAFSKTARQANRDRAFCVKIFPFGFVESWRCYGSSIKVSLVSSQSEKKRGRQRSLSSVSSHHIGLIAWVLNSLLFLVEHRPWASGEDYVLLLLHFSF